MKRLILLVALGAIGCGDSPTAPTQPVAPACQTQNTAALVFENRSPLNFTYDVYMDGANVASLAPTRLSATQTVVAGVQHRVLFFVTNTTILACTVTPIPLACSTTTYFCAF